MIIINKDAEKFSATTLKTIEGALKSEEITVYGIAKNSRYVDLPLDIHKYEVEACFELKGENTSAGLVAYANSFFLATTPVSITLTKLIKPMTMIKGVAESLGSWTLFDRQQQKGDNGILHVNENGVGTVSYTHLIMHGGKCRSCSNNGNTADQSQNVQPHQVCHFIEYIH